MHNSRITHRHLCSFIVLFFIRDLKGFFVVLFPHYGCEFVICKKETHCYQFFFYPIVLASDIKVKQFKKLFQISYKKRAYKIL